jgi:hypothetical protein
MSRRSTVPAVMLALLAGAAPAAATGSSPRLLRFDDATRFVVRPATLSFGADGGVQVTGPGVSASALHAGHDGHIRWTRWNATGARGLGTVWINQCRPNCAAGHFASYPVRVQASQVVNGRYTRLALSYRGKVVRYRLRRFGSFFGWQ